MWFLQVEEVRYWKNLKAISNVKLKLAIKEDDIIMSAELNELRKIRQDLDILTDLYVRLIERLIPEEDPEEEDIRAIREEDEIVGEEELFRVLME